MARNPRPAEEEPGLFDLPVKKGSGDAEPAEEPSHGDPLGGDTLPLFEGAGLPPAVEPVEPAEEPPRGKISSEPAPASPELRLRAGLVDLGLILGVGVLVRLGLALLGVRADLTDWPAGAVFLLAFSFVYCVLPLAFWGRTPGMAWIGIQARGTEELHLTFGQTIRRWLGAVITVVTFGLPLLLCLTGGSLSDRLSASRTLTLR